MAFKKLTKPEKGDHPSPSHPVRPALGSRWFSYLVLALTAIVLPSQLYAKDRKVKAETVDLGDSGWINNGKVTDNIKFEEKGGDKGILWIDGDVGDVELAGELKEKDPNDGIIEQTGSGTTSLSAQSGYQGAINITGGKIEVVGSGRLGNDNGGNYDGAISVGSSGIMSFNTSADQTMSGALTGSGSLLKDSTGTLTLTNNNTFSGATTINGGTLAFSGSGSIAEASTITVNNTGTLRFDRNDTWGNANTDTSASITINAGGTMESGGNYNTIRDLTLNGGTVALTGGDSSTYPSFALKGTVSVGGSQASQINTVSGSNNAINIGDADLGATVFDVSDATGNADADLVVGAVLQDNSDASGNSITKTGSGTMELTGSNTYTGTTTVSAGTLRMVNSSAGNAIRGSSSTAHNYAIASGATLEFNRTSGNEGIEYANISGLGTFKTSGNAEINHWSASSTVAMGSGALIHVESGTYRFGGGGIGDWSSNLSDMQVDSGATFNGAATPTVVNALNGGGTVLTGGGITLGVDNGSGSFSGVIGNSGDGGSAFSVTKSGSGTQTLSGANTYTGDTTINGGTLEINGAGNLGSGTYSGAIANSGALKQNSTTNQTLSGVISGSGSLVKDNSGTLTLTGDNTYTGGTTINASTGTLVLEHANAAGTGAIVQTDADSTLRFNTTGTIANDMTLYNFESLQNVTLSGNIIAQDATYRVATDTETILSGDISGTGKLSQLGNNPSFRGVLTLTGANNYEGDTEVDSVLNVGSTGALSENSKLKVNSGGLVKLNNFDSRVAALEGNGAIQGSAALTAGDNTDSTFAGVLQDGNSGALSFIKKGSGKITLSGASTFTGNTTLDEGSISLQNLEALGTGSIAQTDGNSTLIFDTTGTFDNDLNIYNIKILQDMTISGNIIANNATYDVDEGVTVEASGDITGTGGTTKLGLGTQVLSGNNTYTGANDVQVGTLRAGSTTAFGNNVATTVDSGAVLELDGFSNSIGSLAGAGTVENANATAATLTTGGDNTSTTFSGVLQDGTGGGALSLTKTGTGTQTLSGANTYTGNTTISAGTLEIGGAGQLGSGSYAGAISNSGTFNYNSSANQTLSGVISGAGVLTKDNTGTLTLSGANTYTGGAVIRQGTLIFTDEEALGTGTVTMGFVTTEQNLEFGASGMNLDNSFFIQNTNGANRTIRLDVEGTATGVISGNTDLRLSSAGIFRYDVGADDTLTNSGNISNGAGGGAGITKIGSGTLVLSGSNTYTGSSTVSAGTLKVQSQTALGTTTNATTVADGATLELNYTPPNNSSPIEENITLNGAGVGGTEGALKITGTGGGNELGNNTITLGSDATINTLARFDTNSTITDNGNGYTLTKTGSNYSHFMNASGVTADFTHLVIAEGDYWAGPNALPGGVGTSVTVANGAQLTTWGAQVIANSPDITFEGGSTFRTDRANDTMSINGTMTLNGNVTFSGPQATHTANIDSTIGGSGTLFKTGPNTTILSGDNTHAKTQIGLTNQASNAGTLSITHNNALGAGSLDYGSGGTLDLGVSGLTVGNNVFIGNRSDNSDYKIRLDLAGNATGELTNNIEIRKGTAKAFVAEVGDGDTLTFSGSTTTGAGGGAGITKTGAGTLRLTNANNSFSGKFYVDGGELQIADSGRINDQEIVIASGATFRWSSSAQADGGDTYFTGGIRGDGTFIKDGSNSIFTTRFGTYDIANIKIHQGTMLGVGNINALGQGTTTVYLGDTSGSESAAMNYGGALSGAMTTKDNIIVQAGSSGTKTFAKGNGNDMTDNTTITLNDDLTVNTGSAGTLTLGGVISGSGGLVKTNTGTLELTGANTFTGATTVSAGILALNNTTTSNTTIAGDGTIGTFDVTISGGTLRNDANEQIANNASITMSSGAYSLNGATETIDGFTNSGGTFTTGTGTLTGLGNTITWSGGTNTINDGGTVQDQHFDVSGGTNTVEGGATGGTLHVQSGGTGFEFTGTGTPNVTLNSDATNAGRMLLEGNLTVADTITGTATISNGGAAANSGFIDMNGGTRTFTVNDATPDIDLEISALITNGGLTKAGTGTMELTGVNTYDGGTDINAGTLLINASNAGAIGDVNINSGGTLGGTGTVGGATTLNSGGFLSAGDGGIGTLTFEEDGAPLNSLDISDSGLSGSLLFDLGAQGTGDLVVVEGQISIGNGLLGDGLLDMNDFAFTNLGATSVTGTYTWNLFQVGSYDFTTLGSNTTSTPFASIKSAELAISGNFIQLTMTVPEPSSIALLGLGLSSLLLRRRRS